MNTSSYYQRGFNLIELMMVIAIISLLVALGIPAYQDYVVRAKVTEALTLSTGAKMNMLEFYQSMGHWPEDNQEAGLPEPEEFTGSYISSIKAQQHTLSITFNEKIGPMLATKNILFSAIPSPSGHVTWQCNAPDIDNKYLPSSCRNKRS